MTDIYNHSLCPLFASLIVNLRAARPSRSLPGLQILRILCALLTATLGTRNLDDRFNPVLSTLPQQRRQVARWQLRFHSTCDLDDHAYPQVDADISYKSSRPQKCRQHIGRALCDTIVRCGG
jgi:hypothetical protein